MKYEPFNLDKWKDERAVNNSALSIGLLSGLLPESKLSSEREKRRLHARA